MLRSFNILHTHNYVELLAQHASYANTSQTSYPGGTTPSGITFGLFYGCDQAQPRAVHGLTCADPTDRDEPRRCEAPAYARLGAVQQVLHRVGLAQLPSCLVPAPPTLAPAAHVRKRNLWAWV